MHRYPYTAAAWSTHACQSQLLQAGEKKSEVPVLRTSASRDVHCARTPEMHKPTHEGQADAGVATRRLDNDALASHEPAILLCLLDHPFAVIDEMVVSNPGLCDTFLSALPRVAQVTLTLSGP